MQQRPLWGYLLGLITLGGYLILAPYPWHANTTHAEIPNYTPTSRPTTQTAQNPSSRPTTQTAQAPFPKDSAVCQTGCAAGGHGGHHNDFSHQKYKTLLQTYAQHPPTASHIALETLLFYTHQTRAWLDQDQGRSLPPAHRLFLQAQLQQRHAYVSLRIVDRKGVRRVWMAPKRVVLGEHFHLHADETTRIQAPSFGGRVERVGLYHLWTRI